MICNVAGCDRPVLAKSLCMRHYCKWKKYGDPTAGKEYNRMRGSGCITADGYIVTCQNYVKQLEHVVIAEKALGHALPAGAKVHHVDENKAHNANTNLVICPSESYHQLLHSRMRAMAACGNPNWRICTFCKIYDDPTRMYTRTKTTQAWHIACRNTHDRTQRKPK